MANMAPAEGALIDLLHVWGTAPAGTGSSMPCDIGDDGFPIEFSVAFAPDGTEVRVLVEARDASPEMTSRWAAGLALSQRIEERHGASLDRLRRIADLFAPTDPRAHFAMWHAVGFREDSAPRFKLYLNPQAQGKERATQTTEQMLERLGFARSGGAVTTRTRPEDEIRFVSLDLCPSRDARVKVYKVHPHATRGDIERELGAVPDLPPGLIIEFFEALVGSEGPFGGRPMTTYIALSSESEEPVGGTVHFPIRDYVADDAAVRERLCRILTGEARATYERSIAAFAARPLSAGVGMHSYVSLGVGRGGPRITVYLSPEGYRVEPPRTERGTRRPEYARSDVSVA
jgi:hypothetical protein